MYLEYDKVYSWIEEPYSKDIELLMLKVERFNLQRSRKYGRNQKSKGMYEAGQKVIE